MKPSLSSGMESGSTTFGENSEGPMNVRELVLKSESEEKKQSIQLVLSVKRTAKLNLTVTITRRNFPDMGLP